MRLSRWVVLCMASFALGVRGAAAQEVDIIRGRITDADSIPLQNAVITATSISGMVNRTARTNADGRFTITFPGGDGDYMITVAALGFAARRFEVKRLADEDILIADAQLQRVNAVLEAVTVSGGRDRPRTNDASPDISGSERTMTSDAVPADLLGDLAAMAATLPGVEALTNADGSLAYSVLGLGADQNNTTLNGMSFDGSSLPRDAAVTTSLATSPYDVARGGFSGAQISIRARSGSNFKARTLSLNAASPETQWSDEATQALGQEYTNASLGGLVSGPLVYDRAFYNVSYQVGRRSNPFETLLTTDALGLKAAGVSADSATRLLSIMSLNQIPATMGRVSDDRLGDSGSLFGSIDLTSPTSSSGQAINMLFNGSWSRQSPSSGDVTDVPAFGGDRTNWRFGAQARHSGYFGVLLTETSVAASTSRNHGEPYLDLPAGRVRVSSTFGDGSSGVQMLSFGGNQSLSTTQTNLDLQGQNQLSWFSANNKHRLKLTSALKYGASDQLVATNTLGTFTFNSLADLEAGVPASFQRQLAPRARDVRQLQGGLSLGDSYRRTTNLQLTYGVRIDGSRFLTTPAFNPALDTLFGIRNDQVPNRIYVSPRVGFSWTYGSARQIAAFQGAARVPRAVIRGGVGVFQNLPGANQITGALDNTGLPDAAQQMTCVGSAAPVPDWGAYFDDPASIPTQCVGGGTGPFANTAPSVTAFAANYVSPRSLRSNLQWSGATLNNRFSTSVDVTYSLNLNQSSNVDLNFVPDVRFALAEEAGRPVYASESSIVPTTGAMASRDARVTSRYSRVNETRSDLRSESYQATLRVSPIRFSSAWSWNVFYTYSYIRDQFRGFSNTIGNPLEVEWGRSGSSPHQIGYNLSYNFFDAVRVSWNGQFRSGTRFTPMISGDVNGDGNSNDRAFVFSPATASDPVLAADMQNLLATGSRVARECLAKQIGRFAARNSCQGPWSSTANMSFSFNPLKVRMPQRATLSFNLANPLGAADLLINGSDHLRGWGQRPFLSNSLLFVRGFEPATGITPARYRYEVNQRFAATNPSFSRIRAPVTLTAMVRVDVGPTRENQNLIQQLDRGRRRTGTRANEQVLRGQFNNGGLQNPMAAILRGQDSLKLTVEQADSVATLNRWYVVKLEGIWAPLVRDFARLPDRYDEGEAYHRYVVARRATVDLLRGLAPHVRGLLTPEQFRQLPPLVATYLDDRFLASVRSGTAGQGGGGFGGRGGGRG